MRKSRRKNRYIVTEPCAIAKADPLRWVKLTPPALREGDMVWDRHSLADYDAYLKAANLSFRLRRRTHLLALDPDIASELRAVSKARGLSPETVANV